MSHAMPTTSGSRTCARLARLLAVPAALAGALGLAGCSSGPSPRTASAVFSDVGDLANGAQVQLADVPVGSVTSIALSGNTVYVGCYQSSHGIAAIDVTNPAAPVLIGYTATTASLDVQDLLFTGGDLYALSGDPNGNFNILSTGGF